MTQILIAAAAALLCLIAAVATLLDAVRRVAQRVDEALAGINPDDPNDEALAEPAAPATVVAAAPEPPADTDVFPCLGPGCHQDTGSIAVLYCRYECQRDAVIAATYAPLGHPLITGEATSAVPVKPVSHHIAGRFE